MRRIIKRLRSQRQHASRIAKANRRRMATSRKRPRGEVLEDRRLLAVTAVFDAELGTLSIQGDDADNTIEVSTISATDNTLVVNGGAIPITGGTATTDNTQSIQVDALGGDDFVTINETNGPLPSAILLGGDGDDYLRGGSGDDTIVGGRGNDTKLGESGDDLLVWNNGDGSDLMEGGEGDDTVQVNGADAAGDNFEIDPNGQRVAFQRTNLGLFVLDIGSTETLDVNGQGGDDQIEGSAGLAGLIQLDLDGGDGDDVLIGGDGDDYLRGGSGDDTIVGGRGNDTKLGEAGDDLLVWNNGDGSDLMEGGEGDDTVQVNGADSAGDRFRVTRNQERLKFQRTNLGRFALDIGSTETLDVNEQGGNGSISVGNLSGVADLETVDIDGGAGNDRILATSLNEGVQLVAEGGDGRDVIFGSRYDDIISGGRGNDRIFGRDGDDVIDGGDGRDIIFAGLGNDDVKGGAGNDVLFGGGGDDYLDGGDGFDILIGGSGDDRGKDGEINLSIR
ncbi:MAG: calcium-binding protein [Planctomycetota bacterium]